jgi:hypothetical protein
MKKLLAVAAVAVAVVFTMAGCASGSAVKAPRQIGWGPYVDGPMMTPALRETLYMYNLPYL